MAANGFIFLVPDVCLTGFSQCAKLYCRYLKRMRRAICARLLRLHLRGVGGRGARALTCAHDKHGDELEDSRRLRLANSFDLSS